MMSVEESVYQTNRDHSRDVFKLRSKCHNPACDSHEFTCFWGISPLYKSEYNPGEYIQYTCIKCGWKGEELPS